MKRPLRNTFAPLMLLCALCLCPAPAARAATVRLLNGESSTGNVLFSNGQVQIATSSGTSRIDLDQILDAVFREDRNRAGLLSPGAMLVNGTLVAAQIPAPFTDPLKVGQIQIPLSSVAWVIYQPLPRDKISMPASGQTGAILFGGDFLQGVIGTMQDDRVAINSPLLGPQRLSIRERPGIAALVFHDIRESTARYEVTSRDGSMYLADDIKAEGDNIVIYDSIAGNVKINNNDLYEIRLAANQYQYLTHLKPDRVDPPKGIDAATAVQTVQDTNDTGIEALQTAANTAVTYTVPKGFVSFTADVSVPQGAPAGTHFTFAMYGDGKFLTGKSTPVAAGEKPQHIHFTFTNLHTITLRVEPDTLVGSAAPALWTQPMFLRH